MNFLITGGAGYIGTKLTKHLLSKSHNVVVVDNLWFGNKHTKHKNLKIIKEDVRNFDKLNIKKIHTIIHLANIANDPTVELNPTLSWEVNVLASKIIAEHAIKNKVKKIIYFSSGSVYGVKKEKKVTEDLKLDPISVYNKTKMIAERIFLSYKNQIEIKCLRPATVSGFSERLRLDLTVNKLTFDAYYKKKIFVDGGAQIRPTVNLKDIIRVVDHLLFAKKKFKNNIYNMGFENLSIMQVAKRIQKKTGAKLIVKKKVDIRSYRQDSSRLIKTGFKAKFNIDDSIDELILHFSQKKLNQFGENNFNLIKMKKLNVK
jgi:nucleoside-diphosphate-sugar epimerase